jgi:FixJ family two-component response regulator
VRPITDFIAKPLNAKNKSRVIAEAICEGQSRWSDRQRKRVNELI